MNVRLALPRTVLRAAVAPRPAAAAVAVRTLATASPAVTVKHSTDNSSGALLGNIEATWENMTSEEKYDIVA